MTAPLWTQSITTDDQGKRSVVTLTPAQLDGAAGAICEFLAYGKADSVNIVGTNLVTFAANNAAQGAIDRLLAAASHAGTPITTAAITTNTEVAGIARSLGTPQWS